MGGGQTRIGQSPNSCCDTGNDPEGDSRFDQVLAFLTAAAEHERIPALETKHPLTLACEFDQAKRDIALLGRGLATALAGIFELRAGADPIENGGVDERVIDNDVAGLEGMITQKRHEPGCAGACAHEPNPPRFEDRKGLAVKPGEAALLQPVRLPVHWLLFA